MITALALMGLLSMNAFVPAKPGQRPPPAAPVVGVVNLNTATAAQIAKLPGVGKSRAKAIVAYRDKQHFAKPEDLRKVKGVGKGIYQKVHEHLAVSGPTTLEKAPRSEAK